MNVKNVTKAIALISMVYAGSIIAMETKKRKYSPVEQQQPINKKQKTLTNFGAQTGKKKNSFGELFEKQKTFEKKYGFEPEKRYLVEREKLDNNICRTFNATIDDIVDYFKDLAGDKSPLVTNIEKAEQNAFLGEHCLFDPKGFYYYCALDYIYEAKQILSQCFQQQCNNKKSKFYTDFRTIFEHDFDEVKKWDINKCDKESKPLVRYFSSKINHMNMELEKKDYQKALQYIDGINCKLLQCKQILAKVDKQ